MKLFTHCNKSRQSRTACSYFCRCLQFKLERRSEHAIQFYKLSVTFKRPVFDTWTMLRNWVHRGSPWTGYKEVVHRPGPKGWSMDRVQRGGPWTWGPCFVYVRRGRHFELRTSVVHPNRPRFFLLNSRKISLKKGGLNP